jgi:hypothetical protein
MPRSVGDELFENVEYLWRVWRAVLVSLDDTGVAER